MGAINMNGPVAVTDTLAAVVPSLEVADVFPELKVTDLTASAKSLSIKVKNNLAYFQEQAGLDGSLLTLDLANKKVIIDFNLTLSPLLSNRMLALGASQDVVTITTMNWDTLGLYMVAPTAAAASQAGNPFKLYASNATAGLSVDGAAAGGIMTIRGGNADRLSSGNAIGGDILLIAGSGIGAGTAGRTGVTAIGTAGTYEVTAAQGTKLVVRHDSTVRLACVLNDKAMIIGYDNGDYGTVSAYDYGASAAKLLKLNEFGGNISFGGNFIAASDNSLDIGAAGATRPRTGYFGTDLYSNRLVGNVNTTLALLATPPAAITTTQAGVALTLNSSAAVAGSSVAGASNGGAITITSGAAARFSTGNANGGAINLTTAAGIGSGVYGNIVANVNGGRMQTRNIDGLSDGGYSIGSIDGPFNQIVGYTIKGTTAVETAVLKTTTALGSPAGGTLIPLFGAAAVGGAGQPSTADQNGWLLMKNSSGATIYVPCWV